MGIPIVIATNGYGQPITEAANGYGTPVEIATNGYGVPVAIVASGGLPVVGSGGAASAYAPESETIFASFTTPPTTARKDAIDAAVVALKTAGIWSKLDVLHMYAAADAQASLINWKTPGTYNGTVVNSPVFTADSGYTGASTRSIGPGYNPQSAASPNWTANSASLFSWVLNNVAIDAGVAGTVLYTALAPRWSTNVFYTHINNNATNATAASTDSTGFWLGTRTASNLQTMYKNGVSVATDSGATTGIPNEGIGFLSGIGAFWIGGQTACCGICAGLNSTEATALYNALRTYMTGVGVP